MIRIEWIEIPAGKFISGLTAEQRAGLERRLAESYGIEGLDSVRRRWVEDTLKKPLEKFTSEEKRIWEEEALQEYSPLLQYQHAWHALQRIPDARILNLPTFYIARFPITRRQADFFLSVVFMPTNGMEQRKAVGHSKRSAGSARDVCTVGTG